MLKFTSTADLLRLHQTDPAQPVITKLANSLFSETSNTDNDPVTITLMQSHDVDNPLTELCNAEDVSLEGVIEHEQGGMYLVVLQTDYQYGLVLVIQDEDWLTSELRQCIEQNIYH